MRFAENETFTNMFQVSFEQLNEQPFPLKGKWKSEFFCNDNPITLELGCGKGDYTVGLAEAYPNLNHIGMDIKGARMWLGCKMSLEKKMSNVAFIRSKIQLIQHFFSPGEVDEIWITFPDPQPRSSREKKRLTSPEFLKRYRKVLKPNGIIHLKTDDDQLFQYTLNVINELNLNLLVKAIDIHNGEYSGDVNRITTYYEKIWIEKGLAIKYLKFELTSDNE